MSLSRCLTYPAGMCEEMRANWLNIPVVCRAEVSDRFEVFLSRPVLGQDRERQPYGYCGHVEGLWCGVERVGGLRQISSHMHGSAKVKSHRTGPLLFLARLGIPQKRAIVSDGDS